METDVTVTANWTDLRERLWTRCAGRCEVTGRPLDPRSWAAHHRRKKGMGGTSRPDVHTLPNLMAVTHEAHNLSRPSVHLDPAWANERGYLVPWWGAPRLEPVWLFGRQWVFLTDDGRYRPLTTLAPPGADAGGARV
jgi:hypothetical protein